MSEIKVNSVKGVGASTAAITINNSDGTCDANLTAVSGGQLANRNMMVNGGFQVAQRLSYEGSGYSQTGGEYIGIDMFRTRISGGNSDGTTSVLLQQTSTAPVGFCKSLKLDVTTAYSSLSSGAYNTIVGEIEGYDIARTGFGAAGAKTLTLSFYVRSNLTGTFTGAVGNSSNNRSFAFNYTISSANTWERKTITIDGDTTGTWHKDSQMGLKIIWTLGVGTQYLTSTANTWQAGEHMGTTSGQNILASTDNELYLTGVQLEVGSVATEFEHKSFNDEFKRCCRYYQKARQYGAPNEDTDSWNTAEGFISQHKAAMRYDTLIRFPHGEMRAAPTVIFRGSSGAVNSFRFEIIGVRNDQISASPDTLNIKKTGIFLRISLSSGTPDDNGYRSGNGNAFQRTTFEASAEF